MSLATEPEVAAATLTTGAAGEASAAPVKAPTAGPSDGALAPGLSSADVTRGERLGLVRAAKGSPMASIRQRREAAAAQLYHDLEVPRMGGVWVRYRPVFSPEINAITERVTENKMIDKHRKPLVINAAVLAASCLGVYLVDEDGKPMGDPSSWPTFGPELREELGKTEEECKSAADVAEALYLTHGDLMAASVELTQWSTQESNKRREESSAGG